MANFHAAVMECYENKQFLGEYDRIMGTTLSKEASSPIERMIDDATGYVPTEELMDFILFVEEFVWNPLFEGGEASVDLG